MDTQNLETMVTMLNQEEREATAKRLARILDDRLNPDNGAGEPKATDYAADVRAWGRVVSLIGLELANAKRPRGIDTTCDMMVLSGILVLVGDQMSACQIEV